ncbi:hypothetical protein ZOSMA_28G00140 [Zostera marina]|uniref:Uncharacterized protein n=1 Tax=Zostera marina TaxID=29655 RepID=A0A0K9PC84_ZOSMR|nr:hypothetical protein ZOSMA_28G00140 [Zostera marina]
MKSGINGVKPRFLILAALLAVFLILSMEASAGRHLLEQATDNAELSPNDVDIESYHPYHGHWHHGHHHRHGHRHGYYRH